MADFNALYERYGLSELVKHAFRHESEGYRFLLGKVLGEAPLYTIVPNCTAHPFMDADTVPFIPVFSSRALAESECERISRVMACEVVEIGTKTGAKKEVFFRLARDVGAGVIVLDNAIRIPVQELVAPAEYDGYKEGYPLRNEQMNATLLLIRQGLELGRDVTDLYVHLFHLLEKSGFISPLSIARDRAPGPLGDGDLKLPIFDSESGRVSYWFSSAENFEAFEEANPEFMRELGIRYLYFATLDDFRQFLSIAPDTKLVINPGSLNLAIDRDLLTNIESLAAGKAVVGKTESVSDDDPMPDFLR